MIHKKSQISLKALNNPKSINFLLCFSILYFICSYVLLYMDSQNINLIRAQFYDADLLFPFSLYEGFFNEQSITGWMFSGVIPLFPDLFLTVLFWLISKNIHISIILYALFQPVIMTLSLVFLSWCVGGKNKLIFSMIFFFSALPIMLISTGKFFTFFYIFSWYKHFGLLCLEFFALGITILFFKEKPDLIIKKSIWKIIILNILTIITIASDPLFITQFVAPILGVFIFLLFFKIIPKMKTLIAGGSLLISTGIGLLLYKFPILFMNYRINLFNSYINPIFNRIPQNWLSMTKSLTSLWDNHTYIWFIWFLFYIYCFLASVYIIHTYLHNKYTHIINLHIFIFLFILFQLGLTICIPVLTGSIAPWYFHPIAFIPLFGGWPFVIENLLDDKKINHYLHILICGFVTLGIIVTIRIINLPSGIMLTNLFDYYPNYIECIDNKAKELKLHYGIANYWQARQITLLSKSGLRAVQVTPSISPFHWENNSTDYDKEFNFIVINHADSANMLNSEVINTRFGNPALTFYCGQNEILVYNRSDDKLFRNPFEGQYGDIKLSQVGGEITILASALPYQNGILVGNSRVADKETKIGVLTYGPYVNLYSGEYKFQINYDTQNLNSLIENVGEWDVVSRYKNMTIQLKKGDLLTGRNFVNGKFKIINTGTIIEIRTFYHGHSDLAVKSIMIKRIK